MRSDGKAGNGTGQIAMSEVQCTDPFCHAPLPSPDWIRLLEIGGAAEGTMPTYVLRSLPLAKAAVIGYDALSYAWGTGSMQFNICVDGRELNIGQNLHDFLQELHGREWKGLLWVDAICIDQKNIKERNSQVEMMAEIYRAAHTVRVWLGTGSYRLRYLIAKPRIKKFQENLDQPSSQCVDFLRLLSSCPYWTRAWVVQELASATTKTIDLHYADQTLPMHDLWDLILDADSFKTWYTEGTRNMSQVKPMMNILRRVDRSYPQLQLFESIIHDFSHLACAEPRDHIYAFKALYQDKIGNRLPIDYGVSLSELISRALDCCETRTNLHSLFTILQTWQVTPAQCRVAVDRPIHARLCPQLSTAFQLPVGEAQPSFYLSHAEPLLAPHLKLALISVNSTSTSSWGKHIFLRTRVVEMLKHSQMQSWSVVLLYIHHDLLFPQLRPAEGWDDQLTRYGGIAVVTFSDIPHLAIPPQLGVWLACSQQTSQPNHPGRDDLDKAIAQLKACFFLLERGLRGATFEYSKQSEVKVGLSLASWLALHNSIQDTPPETIKSLFAEEHNSYATG